MRTLQRKHVNSTIRRLRRSLRAAWDSGLSTWEDKRFTESPSEPLSPLMVETTRQIRGNHPPAIIIHGVMPRSGTVYCGNLLWEHPDVYAYPNEIWEMPLLHSTYAVQALQESFLRGYKQNRSRFAQNDFLALIGSAFIGYLHAQIPEGKRLLMKVPLASHLSHFSFMFPHEQCLMVMRDGRDLTASTLRSWPGRDFVQVATAWRDAAAYMLSLDHPLYRYEDIVSNPAAMLRSICETFELDSNRYPFESIPSQPVKGSSEFVQDKGWDDVQKSNDFSSVGRWTNWSKREKECFKNIAGDILVEAGYVENQDW